MKPNDLRGRAWTRFQLMKRKQKMYRIWMRQYQGSQVNNLYCWWESHNHYLGTNLENWVGSMARTPHPCSGPCCGNPRHHFGVPPIKDIRRLLLDEQTHHIKTL